MISSNNEQTVLMLRIMNNVLLFSLLHVVDTDVLKDRSISIHYDSQSTKKLVDHLANKQFYDLKFLMADESVDPLKLIQTFYDTFETDINLSWYEKDWLINKWYLQF